MWMVSVISSFKGILVRSAQTLIQKKLEVSFQMSSPKRHSAVHSSFGHRVVVAFDAFRG